MSAATLERALARWEAESGSYRRLCGMPYRLEPFLAGYFLGALGMKCPDDPPHTCRDSFRVGHREGVGAREIEARAEKP